VSSSLKPWVAHFVSSSGDDRDRLRRILLELQLDRVWLHTAERRLGPRRWLQVETYDLRTGQPLVLDLLAERLSSEGRAFQLVADGRWARYRLFQEGRLVAADEGMVDDPTFGGRCLERLGCPWDELAGAAGRDERSAEIAAEGTEVLVRGRLLALPPGTPRWPQLFTFHARNGAPQRDQLSLVLLDLARAEQLCRQPAAEVLRFLAVIEAVGPAVLGPLHGALAEVRSLLAQVDDQQPPAALAATHPLIYEVLAMGTALGYGLGDELSYFDERFFPLLSLADSEMGRPIEDGLDEIAELGVLSAMVEVLPYSVPEGELLEAFADGEIAPLPRPSGDSAEHHAEHYEGSLFLLDHRRLAGLVQAFDGEALARRAQRFLRQWHRAMEVETDFDRWCAQREAIDGDEILRFSETASELKVLLALAEVHQLRFGLLFYTV
jgi:hypothetical protein